MTTMASPSHADTAAASASPRHTAPLTAAAAAASERFTQWRVERIIALVAALGNTVLGTQAFLNALASTQETEAWRMPLRVAAFVPLVVMVIALIANVRRRVASGAAALAIVVVIACWPFATAGGAEGGVTGPWIWYLLNVATAAAVVAFALPLQIVWTVLVPVLYIVARLAQLGWSGPHLAGTVRDGLFALILGGVIVALGWMLRAGAVDIDRARRDAVRSYAAAAEADAGEKERVAVAALMHDSVLAALIAAERAATPREEALAVVMAREALTRLANAEQDAAEGPDAPVAVATLVGDIEGVGAGEEAQDGATGAPSWRVRAVVHPGAGEIPGRVARAIVLAVGQAIANAVEHARAADLRVTVRADALAVTVLVEDGGPGFDPAAVGEDRLGIRGSIVARMAAVGGRALINTGPTGTSVLLEWTRPR